MKHPLQVDTDLTAGSAAEHQRTVTRILDADGCEVAEITWTPRRMDDITPSGVAEMICAAVAFYDTHECPESAS